MCARIADGRLQLEELEALDDELVIERLTSAHVLSAIGTDAAGNAASSALSSVTVNNVVATPLPGVPSVPNLVNASDSGASNTDNVTNDTTPTFSGTSTNSTSVAILVDGVVRVTGAPAAGGAYTLTTPALTNGAHAITARGINGANTSAVSAPLSVTIDNVAPTVATLSASYPTVQLASGATTTTLPVRVAWTATDATSGITSYQLQRATGAAGAFANQTLATPTTTNITQQLTQGTLFRYQVRATDLAGNVAAFSAAFSRTAFGAGGRPPPTPAPGAPPRWPSPEPSVAPSATAPRPAPTPAGRSPVATSPGSAPSVPTAAMPRCASTASWWPPSTWPPRRSRRARSSSRPALAAGSHTIQVRALGTHSAGSTANRVDIDGFIRLN